MACKKNLFLCLIIGITVTKITAIGILIPEKTQNSFSQLGHLLPLCFPDRVNPIVITKNVIDVIDPNSWDSSRQPLMIIDKNSKAKDIQAFHPSYPSYILSGDSNFELQNILYELKSSRLWSIESIFLIIDSNKNSCDNASAALHILWKMDLLSVYFVCQELEDENNSMMLYTYNPFTNYAPPQWKKVNLINESDHRWTVFKRKYINGEQMCQNLTFDKTKVLDGYEVRAVGNPTLKSNWSRDIVYDFKSMEGRIPHTDILFFEALFSTLNVTPVIRYDNFSYFNGSAVGYLKTLMNGTNDMSLDLSRVYGRSRTVIDTIKTFHQNGYLILTQKRDFFSPLGELIDFLALKFVIMSIFFLLFIFVIIYFNNNRDINGSVLDILRILVGTGILTPLERLSMQIVFLVANLLVFVVSPIVQGQWSAMLVRPERFNPETLKDLHDLKFHVYFFPSFLDNILDQKLWTESEMKYLHPLPPTELECHEQVLKNASAACLAFSDFQIEAALKYNLHVSKSLIFETYWSYWNRRNWALKHRVDKVGLRLKEAGLLDYWDQISVYSKLKKIKARDSAEKLMQGDQSSIDEILLDLIFIGLGVVFGILIFGFEILLRKVLCPRPPIRRRLRLRQRIVIINRRIVILNKYI